MLSTRKLINGKCQTLSMIEPAMQTRMKWPSSALNSIQLNTRSAELNSAKRSRTAATIIVNYQPISFVINLLLIATVKLSPPISLPILYNKYICIAYACLCIRFLGYFSTFLIIAQMIQWKGFMYSYIDVSIIYICI